MSETPPKWRTRAQAAQRVREVHGIPCLASSLAQHASYGTGPIYRIILSKAAYLDADIDAWAVSLISKPIRRAGEARRHRVRAVVA